MKRYNGSVDPNSAVVVDVVEGSNPGYRLAHHYRRSVQGFNWGYRGQGPSDLALAILQDHSGVKPDTATINAFEEGFVAHWPMNQPWSITSDDIDAWLATQPENASRRSVTHGVPGAPTNQERFWYPDVGDRVGTRARGVGGYGDGVIVDSWSEMDIGRVKIHLDAGGYVTASRHHLSQPQESGALPDAGAIPPAGSAAPSGPWHLPDGSPNPERVAQIANLWNHWGFGIDGEDGELFLYQGSRSSPPEQPLRYGCREALALEVLAFMNELAEEDAVPGQLDSVPECDLNGIESALDAVEDGTFRVEGEEFYRGDDLAWNTYRIFQNEGERLVCDFSSTDLPEPAIGHVAEFFANSRQYVRALVDEVRSLRPLIYEVQELRAQLAQRDSARTAVASAPQTDLDAIDAELTAVEPGEWVLQESVLRSAGEFSVVERHIVDANGPALLADLTHSEFMNSSTASAARFFVNSRRYLRNTLDEVRSLRPLANKVREMTNALNLADQLVASMGSARPRSGVDVPALRKAYIEKRSDLLDVAPLHATARAPKDFSELTAASNHLYPLLPRHGDSVSLDISSPATTRLTRSQAASAPRPSPPVCPAVIPQVVLP